jgi:response regulator RpfG family c-di-GMP phosphodiesterase
VGESVADAGTDAAGGVVSAGPPVPDRVGDADALDVMSETEMDRVRMHPYPTQRTLSRVPRLARLAELAAAHHERLDGSVYPRGLVDSALSPTARILAGPTSTRR